MTERLQPESDIVREGIMKPGEPVLLKPKPEALQIHAALSRHAAAKETIASDEERVHATMAAIIAELKNEAKVQELMAMKAE